MNRPKTASSDIVKLLAILCPMVYFASYLTRKDYSIVMEAIIQSEGISKNAAGFVETLSVISYGAGQVISGFLGDRIKPHHMIATGLSVTILINFAMPFSPASLRAALWFVNGFAQSMLWPPLLRILTTLMDSKTYEDTAVNTNIAGIFSTILIYLSSSLLWIGIFHNWKLTFLMDAAVALVVLLFWLFSMKKIDAALSAGEESHREEKHESPLLSGRFLFTSGFFLIALGIILQGMLRDGITDWVPSFIANTFDLPSGSAIFKSVVLPLIGVISLKVTGEINRRFVKEEVRAAGWIFILGAALCLLLFGIYTRNQYITLFTASFIVGCMHAVNLFLVSILPNRFAKYGIVSTMSGIINSLTYVGSALAIYGFGFISEKFGWSACVLSWIIIASLGALVCFLAIPSWQRFKKQ